MTTNHLPTALDARQLAHDDLALALRHARARTWACVDDLTEAQWLPPHQAGINPIAWELAHLAWFAEYWTLRSPHGVDAKGFASSPLAPRFAGPDEYFDSARLAHADRWSIRLPSPGELKDLLAAQLEASLKALTALATTPAKASSLDGDLYFHRLALFHEDMHCEALCWLRSTLAYPAPPAVKLAPLPGLGDLGGLEVAGGDVHIGQMPNAPGFTFDNEREGKKVQLVAFEIDAAPVSALAFSRFVDAGGYDNPAYWPAEAGQWRRKAMRSHPQQWRKGLAGAWQVRWFDQWLALEGGLPAIHLNAYEAEAYCLWAKRRLPSAAEWEHAALAAPGFHWGHSVWEWTSDAFLPYPGFAPGPYRDYSQPWFGNHRELRGGAFATETRMHNPRYRNFFMPHRSDIFAGFRTVSLENEPAQTINF